MPISMIRSVWIFANWQAYGTRKQRYSSLHVTPNIFRIILPYFFLFIYFRVLISNFLLSMAADSNSKRIWKQWTNTKMNKHWMGTDSRAGCRCQHRHSTCRAMTNCPRDNFQQHSRVGLRKKWTATIQNFWVQKAQTSLKMAILSRINLSK